MDPSEGSGRIEVIHPATEDVIAVVRDGTAADVDKAVGAAREALAGWSATPPAERADYLQRTHEAIVARTDELAALLSKDRMPLAFAQVVEVGRGRR